MVQTMAQRLKEWFLLFCAIVAAFALGE